MVEKKVDGLKKMSQKDIDKSKKIVLDTISEEMEKLESQEPKKIEKKSIKVDGIINRKEAPILKKEISKKIKKEETKKQIIDQPPTTIIQNKLQQQEGEVLDKKEIELRKKQKELFKQEMAKLAPAETTRDNQKHRLSEKNEKVADDFLPQFKKVEEKPEEEVKKSTKELKLKRQEIKRQEKAKKKQEEERNKRREEEKKRNLELKKKAEEEKERKRKKREERKKKRKDKMRILVKNLKLNVKKSILILTAFIVVGLLFHSIIVLLVIRFNLDNKIIREYSKIVPIPAFITMHGFVDFYKYKDLRDRLSAQTDDLEQIKKEINYQIINTIILNELIVKYKLPYIITNTQNLDPIKKLLSEHVIVDTEINQVGINRIQKIKQLLDKENNFVQNAAKFGDGQGRVSINDDNKDEYSYSDLVDNLEINEISEVIVSDQGYYIFECINKTAENITLNYVYIKSKSIEEYISERTQSIKIWSLIN